VGVGCSFELLDCRLQSLSRTTNQLRGAIFFVRKCCLLAPCQHTQKNGERRVLFPLKRANIAGFGLCDRAAGLQLRFLYPLGVSCNVPALRARTKTAFLGSRCPLSSAGGWWHQQSTAHHTGGHPRTPQPPHECPRCPGAGTGAGAVLCSALCPISNFKPQPPPPPCSELLLLPLPLLSLSVVAGVWCGSVCRGGGGGGGSAVTAGRGPPAHGAKRKTQKALA
jgi:hypothetical protein